MAKVNPGIKRVLDEAHEAGMQAGRDAMPTPMHVVQRANPFDDTSPIIKRYAPVMDGVCGFGWVNISPGNCKTANTAKALGIGSKAYYGGVDIWVREFGQSYERKMAYARAYAAVLNAKLPALDPRFKSAYGSGRLD